MYFDNLSIDKEKEGNEKQIENDKEERRIENQ